MIQQVTFVLIQMNYMQKLGPFLANGEIKMTYFNFTQITLHTPYIYIGDLSWEINLHIAFQEKMLLIKYYFLLSIQYKLF